MKMYKLLGADGKEYLSETPGTFGGNRKLKIYGRLDCPSALSTIRRFPGSYEKSRVFFASVWFSLSGQVIFKAETKNLHNNRAALYIFAFNDQVRNLYRYVCCHHFPYMLK